VGKTGKGTIMRSRKRSALPRWAQVCTVFGAVLMLLSGGVLVVAESLLARYDGAIAKGNLFGDSAGAQHANIQGPLNLLLVGIDSRASNWNEPPRSDSVMIMHVTAGLDRAYLFSIPRDTIVNIPRFDKAQFQGATDKLNAAMAFGSIVPGRAATDAQRGFELLSNTITNYTGIKRFDAGAIINFGGFENIVNAMGGVNMYIDTNVKSEHRQPDGAYRKGNPYGAGYIGPQASYKKGPAYLKGWQALDYVRQRYGLPNGDYDRQRHQQQFVKAMVSQALSANVVTNPIKLDNVLRSAGQSLIFDGRGNTVPDFAFALRNMRSNSIQMIKLPGGGVYNGNNYLGERLEPVAKEFFAALTGGTIDTFMAAHPELVNKDK
jgi:LCP family protein required for cell wall assembly